MAWLFLSLIYKSYLLVNRSTQLYFLILEALLCCHRMQCCAEDDSAEPLQEGALNKKLYSRDLKRSGASGLVVCARDQYCYWCTRHTLAYICISQGEDMRGYV